MRKLIVMLILAGYCSTGLAQDEVNTDGVRNLGTTITGNQEQPKVLYIVPWKSATLGESAIPYQSVSSQTQRVFRHVERAEHVRHLEFLDALEESE